MPSKHLLCAEDHGMVLATLFGRENTDVTIRAALTAIGLCRVILVLNRRSITPPAVPPEDQVWTLHQDIVSPLPITWLIPPHVFIDGPANLTIEGPCLAFERPWYRGTGLVWA